ncbi:MAG TPA: OsmC family protein [Anaerolineaceae bacterium]|nr:OsmC family protein [Anaerolineaceae bacterium]HPN52074.1 OsmC family protein [Anaerolineaceae bacterium]
MNAKVTWKNGLAFTGTVNSGLTLPMDGALPAEGEEAAGFKPMELLAVGLAGCTGMDVISILEKKRQAVSAFEVQVHAERASEHPRVFTRIVIEYIVSGENIDPAAVERAVELSETKYCPSIAMLRQAVPIEHKITIHG